MNKTFLVMMVVFVATACGGAAEPVASTTKVPAAAPESSPATPETPAVPETVAPPPAAPTPAAPVVACDAPTDTPSVDIDWTEFKKGELTFVVKGLPAISEDGSKVAVAYQASDGMRGLANLALDVIDTATGKEVEQVAVVATDEYEDVGELKAAKLKKKIAAANKVLTKSKWTPLAVVVPNRDEVDVTQPPQKVSICGLNLAWAEPKLTITDSTGKELLAADYPAWCSPSYCAGQDGVPATSDECDMPCGNSALIASAAVDAAKKVLVIGIEFTGDDTCIEPDEQVHIVALQSSL